MSGSRDAMKHAVRRVMASGDRIRLVAITIRWDQTTHEIIREEARMAGVTIAQFVREAALIRAAIRSTHRDAPGDSRDFRLLAQEIERRAEVRRS